jgi:hypothetical protein
VSTGRPAFVYGLLIASVLGHFCLIVAIVVFIAGVFDIFPFGFIRVEPYTVSGSVYGMGGPCRVWVTWRHEAGAWGGGLLFRLDCPAN